MNDKTIGAEGGGDSEQEPRFDVKARRPDDVPLAEVERRLIEVCHLPPAKVQALVTALQASPVVVLGREVLRARADKALVFEQAGLQVEISPVLRLAPKLVQDADGSTACPACGERAVLGPERQCPHCGVYVDKVTPEFLMRKRIQEQERSRIAWQMSRQEQQEQHESAAALEARLRAEIRAELESRMGVRHRMAGRIHLAPWQALGAVAGVTALAFAAGWWAPSWSGPSGSAMAATVGGRTVATAGAGQDLDTLLARLDEFAPAAGPGGNAPLSAGDSLRSPGPAARDVASGRPLLGALSTLNGVPAGAAPSPEAGLSGELPADLQPRLLAELALSLAESGQAARALEAKQALDAWRAGSDAGLATLLRRTRLLVDAWALQSRHPAAVGARLESLRTEAAALSDPAERAQTLGELGVVLASHTAVPDSLLHGLQAEAGEALKQVGDNQQHARLLGAWLLNEGALQLIRGRQDVATGQFSRARSRQVALVTLAGQAEDPAVKASLLAMQDLAARLVGEPPSREAMGWPAVLAKVADLPQQAHVLREIAALQPGRLADDVRHAAAALAGRADAANGLVRAQTLGQLALLWAEAGQGEHFQLLRQSALQTPGLAGEPALRLRASLLAQGELSLAQAAHQAGQFAQAEAGWRKVAAYLM